MFLYNVCIVFACEWNVFLFHCYDPIKQCFWIFATRSLCHRKKTGVSNDPSKLQYVYTFSASAFVWCSMKESASFLFIFSCSLHGRRYTISYVIIYTYTYYCGSQWSNYNALNIH